MLKATTITIQKRYRMLEDPDIKKELKRKLLMLWHCSGDCSGARKLDTMLWEANPVVYYQKRGDIYEYPTLSTRGLAWLFECIDREEREEE